MSDIRLVAIQKMDVLMEKFSYIRGLIHDAASDIEKLIEARNTWEVFFAEYDDDPREIPEIPEVVNWIEQSVDAGIPWFYFMRCTLDTMGLRIFMITCGAEPDPQIPGRYLFDKKRVLAFVSKNLKNLEVFAEEYCIPEEISRSVTDNVMAYVSNMISGMFDGEQTDEDRVKDKNKLIKEAAERLAQLEKLYGLNPNVRKYFAEGKLYYSYITGGGVLGSIDTINYDERYANIVRAFEEQTSSVVYHVIEHKDTISLLFVSENYSDWMEERPSANGVMALVFNTDTCENKCGFIKLDILQGALRRRDDTVYSGLPDYPESEKSMSEIESEIVERLGILKNTGMITDLDLAGIYVQEHELCFSKLQDVMGMKVCVVNRLSTNHGYEHYAKILSEQIPQQLYFLMVSNENRLAFLYVSEDPEVWETEKRALEEKRPYAIVVDTGEMTAVVRQIAYQMVNGGPLCLL